MGGSTSTPSTSTSASQPWAAQQPYLQQGFKDAQNIYQGAGPAYYPDSTVAPNSPGQTQAYSMGTSLATNGDSNMNAAAAQNQNLISGNYGAGGDAVFNNIQSQVAPAVNSQFEGAGRYGSDSHASALATGMTNAYAPYASSMMNQALDRAPGFQQGQWSNIQNLNTIGQQQQGQAQNETNDALARYNYNTQLPQLKLNQYMQNVGGNWGNTTTETKPVYQPGLGQQLLGGGLGLLGLAG